MKIRLSHPHLADELARALNATDCFAASTDGGGVDVFVPWLERGGDPDQARTELLFFLRAWGNRHPGFEALLAGGEEGC